MCIAAMGLTITLDSATTTAVNAIDPPMDLQWHGSHAPTELQKLLDRTNTVFCPDTNGTATIQVLGAGTAVDLTGETPAYDISAPGIDRRGSTVIYTSAPNAIILTETLPGTAWEFVIQDSDDSWVPVSKPPAVLAGNDPVNLIQTNFKALAAVTTTAQLSRLQQQLYRCMRLNTSIYPTPQIPILHSRFEILNIPGQPTQYYPAAPQMVATIVFQPAPAFPNYVNYNVQVDIGVVVRGNIVFCDTPLPLGKLASGSGSYPSGFTALAGSDFSIRIGHEQLDSNNQPLYFEDGYTRASDGTVTSIDAAAALDSPTRDMVILHKPEWQQYIVNPPSGSGGTSGTDNTIALKTMAKADAAIRLAQAAVPQRLVQLVGFADLGTSGQIAEIEWSQKQVRTDLRIQTWWMPSGGQLDPRRHDGVHSLNAYPAQDRTQQTRTALGMSGSTQAATTIRPSSTPAAVVSYFPVNLVNNGGSNGTQTTATTYTYDLYALSDTGHTNKLNTSGAIGPQASRLGGKLIGPATIGQAYYDNSGAAKLWATNEQNNAQGHC
jgi:hypothetical protein